MCGPWSFMARVWVLGPYNQCDRAVCMPCERAVGANHAGFGDAAPRGRGHSWRTGRLARGKRLPKPQVGSCGTAGGAEFGRGPSRVGPWVDPADR